METFFVKTENGDYEEKFLVSVKFDNGKTKDFFLSGFSTDCNHDDTINPLTISNGIVSKEPVHYGLIRKQELQYLKTDGQLLKILEEDLGCLSLKKITSRDELRIVLTCAQAFETL